MFVPGQVINKFDVPTKQIEYRFNGKYKVTKGKVFTKIHGHVHELLNNPRRKGKIVKIQFKYFSSTSRAICQAGTSCASYLTVL